MCGTASLLQRKSDLRFRSTHRVPGFLGEHGEVGRLAVGAEIAPALFTRMSSLPKALTVAVHHLLHLGALGDVAADRQSLPAGRLDRRAGSLPRRPCRCRRWSPWRLPWRRARQMALPMPFAPPVTIATRFSSNIAVSLSCLILSAWRPGIYPERPFNNLASGLCPVNRPTSSPDSTRLATRYPRDSRPPCGPLRSPGARRTTDRRTP